MRIIGIDPGIQITGYSVLDCTEGSYEVVTSGSIQTSKEQTTPQRLLEISKDVKIICERYKPDVASVEELFFFKNQKTIIPVAEARGVILAALQEKQVEIAEYTPMQVKLSLTGHGRATKPEVKAMVEQFVTISPSIKLDDTIDSIAIAICHHRNIF